jgi:hypothetical protein
MEQFLETLFKGIWQGVVSAWNEQRWLIVFMIAVLIGWLAYKYMRKLLSK